MRYAVLLEKSVARFLLRLRGNKLKARLGLQPAAMSGLSAERRFRLEVNGGARSGMA